MTGQQKNLGLLGLGATLFTMLAGTPVYAAVSADGLWADIKETRIATRGERWIRPAEYRTLVLDDKRLQTVLTGAPHKDMRAPGQVIRLPMPDGGFQRFAIEEAPVMARALAAKRGARESVMVPKGPMGSRSGQPVK